MNSPWKGSAGVFCLTLLQEIPDKKGFKNLDNLVKREV